MKRYVVALIIIFIALPVRASEFIFSGDITDVGVGDEIIVDVLLDTQGKSINAIEGDIIIPHTMNMREVRTGESLITMWIEYPQRYEDEDEQERIVFSGITPGGLSGQSVHIFSLVLKADKEGIEDINSEDVRVLLNDGLGSEDTTHIQTLRVVVAGESQHRVVDDLEDTDPPGFFDIQIGSDVSLFEGKQFAAFHSIDKGVGIDRYEMKECHTRTFSYFRKWRSVESPVQLRDQSLSSFIWIRAIDKNGNERIVMKTPSNPLLKYADYIIWTIIILIAIVIIVRGKRWIKQKKQD